MVDSEADLGAEEARRQLYDLMRRDIGFREKAQRALELGKAYLGVENGHLTRIDSTGNYWEALESTDPPDGTYPVGLTVNFETTYCRRTIQQEDHIALHDAPNQGWADDPAFETHGLHTYHGVPIEVADAVYGTVCFVSEAPRDVPFTEEESMFAELIGRLLGHALERERHEAELTERDEMIDVLCRVLRHNLGNDLTTIQGHTDFIQDQLPDDAEGYADTVTETIDELLELTGRTRELSALVTESLERRELDVESLTRRLAIDVEEAYPDASISIEEATATQIRALPQLEMALRELLENAAKHAADDPSVTVSFSKTCESMQITVSDDGPGLPEREQAVLEKGSETPLKHGSGLGLWIVYWIVTRHDGSIETTVSETGTTVTITLPHGPVKDRSKTTTTVGEHA